MQVSTKQIVYFTEKNVEWLNKNNRIWCEIEDYEILMAKVYKEHLQKAEDHLEKYVCMAEMH